MEEIFAKGSVIKSFPLILKYTAYRFDDGEKLKTVVSVPKRRIKNATARNRIRRQIKEAFRLNKSLLKNSIPIDEKGLALFFIYTGKENPEYSVIEKKIKLILKELSRIHLEKVPHGKIENDPI